MVSGVCGRKTRLRKIIDYKRVREKLQSLGLLRAFNQTQWIYLSSYLKTINGPMQIISHAAMVPNRNCVRCSRDASTSASYKS